LEENPEGYRESLDKLNAQVPNEFDWVRELVIDIPWAAIDALTEVPKTKVEVIQDGSN
jgi:hypothetical protein